uniref:Uncharacterized protein n=1 Tax=Cryptomonas curvata TaxID=233186 RepID=A0A222AHA8_9CRYP|nr:hypothetical protein [Cryptomonas curvata]ASO75747.1 hypothetical protein [Cryptomonas curvata]
MTNTINWFHEGVRGINLTETKDPVPVLLDRLSSSDEVKIKIQSNHDNLIIQNSNKINSITLPKDDKTKYLQLPKSDRWFSILSNKRSPNFPTKEQKYLLSKLKCIPIYTVVNDNNEIVTASPRDGKQFYSLKWIQEKFNELFFWTHDEGPISINLFFMNAEDASSYLHEICKKEPREAENLGLKIKNVGLDVFYKLNRTSPPKIQSRLIADLKEIDLVLTSYSSTSSCAMHPKQKYSKNWFQGSPIYTIKFQKDPSNRSLSEYFFHSGDEKKVIFFSKKDALRAWKTLLSREPNLHLHGIPSMEIYNLESLLFDMENDGEQSVEIVFVPPYQTYLNLKEEKNDAVVLKNNLIQECLFKAKLNLKNLERFSRGVVWLFTSDTLPSEENSW